MGTSASWIPSFLLLGLTLVAIGTDAKVDVITKKLTAKHDLSSDGTLPVATHMRKGRKWVRSNTTDDALFATSTVHPDSSRKTGAALQSTARVPAITGLPRSCLAQNRCCSSSGLARVSNSAVGTLPFSSVVLIFLVLEQNDGEQITAFCSGTLALRSNVVLTAGHCVTEITDDANGLYTTLTGAKVFFGVRGGNYDRAVDVVGYSTFNNWYNSNIEVADQALLKLPTVQKGHVYGTQDITRRFSHLSGYREPFISIGFPGGGAYPNPPTNMYYTPNPHRNQCMGLYKASDEDSVGAVTGSYGLQLAIHEGMSGGPVLNQLGLIIATNSFSFPSGCSSGLCYNGYTPINNTHYPLSHLLSSLFASSG